MLVFDHAKQANRSSHDMKITQFSHTIVCTPHRTTHNTNSRSGKAYIFSEIFNTMLCYVRKRNFREK